MNTVALIGRLTKDPDVRYGSASGTAVARFSIAIDRGRDRNGNDAGTDYPPIVCFGKTAQLVEKYMGKGRLVGITGRIATDSYEKDGKRVYTTQVVAERIQFLDRAPSSGASDEQGGSGCREAEIAEAEVSSEDEADFSEAEDKLPF